MQKESIHMFKTRNATRKNRCRLKKWWVLPMAVVLVISAAGCSANTNTANGQPANGDTNVSETQLQQTDTGTENILIKVGDIDLNTAFDGSEVVFWYVNNSNYTLESSVILLKVDNTTGDTIIFRVNGDTGPGQTSKRGTVRREVIDEANNTYNLAPLKSMDELSNLTDSYIRYSYEENDESWYVTYDYMVKNYSIF